MKSFQAHHLLWASIPLFWTPILIGGEASFDLQLHDSYFVIAKNAMAFGSSLLVGILGIIYWLLKRLELVKWCTFTHCLLSIGSLLGITSLIAINSLHKLPFIPFFSGLDSYFMYFIYTYLLAQCIFILHLIYIFVRHMNHTGKS